MSEQMTIEQYLAQPSDPEDDIADDLPEDDFTDYEEGGHLASIARSLQVIAASYRAGEDKLQQEQEIEFLEGVITKRNRTIEEIAAVCSKSKSQLAIKVREVINGPAQAEQTEGQQEPDPEPAGSGPVADGTVYEQPEPDAPVDEWRDYGANRGLVDVSQLNRSQIRTALGIPQPGATDD